MKILLQSLEIYKGFSNYYKLQQIQHYFPGIIIGGGAARQVFLNEEFGSTDIDIYHSTPMDQALNTHDLSPFPDYMLTANAYNFKYCGMKVQLIRKIYTTNIEELFNSYDFACCMFAIKDNYIYYTEQAVEDATHKWLNVINLDKDTLHQRVGKYLKKGYIPKCSESTEVFIDFINTSYSQRYDFANELYTPEALFTNYFGLYPKGY